MYAKKQKISTKTTFSEEIAYIHITIRELLKIIGQNFTEKFKKI